MKNQVETRRKQFRVTAKHLPHAALDPIALMRLTHNLTGCQSNPRTRNICIGLRFARGQEPAHGRRLALAPRLVRALIISMLLQAQASQRLLRKLDLIWFWRGLPDGLVLGVVRFVLPGHHGNVGGYVSRIANRKAAINCSLLKSGFAGSASAKVLLRRG